MLIRLISDVHLEFGPFDLPEMVDDKETILVIAGDLGDMENATKFIYRNAPRFRHVVYVLGNHEYYGHCMDVVEQYVRSRLEKITNVSILQNQSVIVDDVAFVGSTLWTDFRDNIGAAAMASFQIADFRVIYKTGNEKTGTNLLRPSDAMYMHQQALDYLFPECAAHKANGRKVVMITHFAVSDHSIHPRYAGNALNYYFAPDLKERILREQPDLVLHGHVHDPFNYKIGETRVFCNPRGYVGHEHNNGFNPCLLIPL